MDFLMIGGDKAAKGVSKCVPHYSNMASRGNNVDFISNMPSEIIDKILTHLPTREAVRTSVLARTWRYRWTSMPDLNFERGWVTLTQANLVKGVNQCLRLHQGPIRKFSVQCTASTAKRKMHSWLCMVLKPDLEELQVGGDEYPFPSHLLLNCKKLSCLKLSGCKLYVPPTFEGFLNLKILWLSYEKVDREIGMLISKSPLVERLTLYSYKSSNDMITIPAPKVKYFKLQGAFKDICLENATVLVDMIIDLHSNERQCNVIKLIGGAPNLERLTIQHFTENFKFGFYRGGLSTTFNYLKIMRLADVYLHQMEGIPLLLELITSAPNLEILVIMPTRSYPSKPKVKSSCWQREYPPGNEFKKLKVIEMRNMICMAHEFEFAKFMLLNSPILEKMVLRSTERRGAVIKRMYKKLPKLPRVSARAEVTFHPEDYQCAFPLVR